jgi:hypothetical protein
MPNNNQISIRVSKTSSNRLRNCGNLSLGKGSLFLRSTGLKSREKSTFLAHLPMQSWVSIPLHQVMTAKCEQVSIFYTKRQMVPTLSAMSMQMSWKSFARLTSMDRSLLRSATPMHPTDFTISRLSTFTRKYNP